MIPRIHRIRHRKGFALVVTLTLLVMITLLAIGLLSLSAGEIRASTQGSHMANARANARLSLMLSLGELQRELGPDQRISAVSGILGDPRPGAEGLANPMLTGVWDSRRETLEDRPDYGRETSFRRWLVSSADPDALVGAEFPKAGGFSDPVTLVGGRRMAGQAVEVRAGKVPLPGTGGGGGAFAWWVGDEGAKGYTSAIDTLERDPGGLSVAASLQRSGTPGAFGMKAIATDFPANTADSDKVLTREQLMLLMEGIDAGEWFHDLTPYSRGLVTDVVNGGMRKDLSLYLERPRPNDPWPRSPAPNPLGPNDQYALSEVDDYDVLAWKYLHSYYHLKDRIRMIGGRPTLAAWRGMNGVRPSDHPNPRWNAGVIRPGPVMTRLLVFVAYGSVRDPVDSGKQVLRLYTYPVLTLWNPYNVDLSIGRHEFNMLVTSVPMEHDFFINGRLAERYNWRTTGGSGVKPVLNKNLTLRAGEARILTPVNWAWDPRHRHHLVHFMEDRPFNYSQRSPGGQSGLGLPHDRPITLTKGAPTDRIRIETKVSLWESGGGAFVADYPATWDIRGNHAPGDDGDWATYQWGNKIGWRYQNSTPRQASPNQLSTLNLPSSTFGEILNAPKPFMVIDAQLKALDEDQMPNKTWRDCIPSHPFQAVTTNQNDATPYFANAYKLTFKSINSYQEAASYVQTAPDDPALTYFGASHFPQSGQSFITDREIPLAPLTSLAQLRHVPQHSVDNLYSSGFFFQNHAIGNSFASPGVPSDRIRAPGWPFSLDMWTNSHGGTIDGRTYHGAFFHQRPNIDRSYAANHLLWDDYFFSSMAAQDDRLLGAGGRRNIEEVVRAFFTDATPLPNERFVPYVAATPDAVVGQLVGRGSPTADGFRKAAAHLMVEGAFNVNSVSVDAWKTMIASAHRKRMAIMEAGGVPSLDGPATYAVSRFSMANGGSASSASGRARENLRWQGYRELDEAQVEELAGAIVKQVKSRGPFRSLAEFVNRRLGPEQDERTRYGALQAALEDPGVSINDDYRDFRITESDLQGTTYANRSAALGSRYEGSPPYVTQADLLNSMGSVLCVRSDTFLLRGYGESRDAAGKVVAAAWCEAVVQRVPAYLEPSDAPEAAPDALVSTINKRFGRRFELLSFRWLAPAER